MKRQMQKTSLFTGLILLNTFFIAACGGVKKAEVSHDPLISPIEVGDFQLQSPQRSVVNTFFLWAINGDGEQIPGRVAKASSLADRVNTLDTQAKVDDEIYQKMVLDKIDGIKNPDFCDICKTKDDEIEDILNPNPPFAPLDAAIASVQMQITKIEDEISKPRPDQASVTSLTKAMSSLQDATKIESTKIKDLPDYRNDTDPGKRIQKLYDVKLRKRNTEWDFRYSVFQIKQVVDYYQGAPQSITFKPGRDGTPQITISKWSLDPKQPGTDKSPTFSTEDGTIINATYFEHGGKFTFDLIAKDEHVIYSFEIVRAKYQQSAEDQRLYYSGDFKKKDAETGKVLRTGSLKISAR